MRREVGSVFNQLTRGGWSVVVSFLSSWIFSYFLILSLVIELILKIIGEGRKGIDLTLILVLVLDLGGIISSRRRLLFPRGMRCGRVASLHYSDK
jgi:hypothetical protein